MRDSINGLVDFLSGLCENSFTYHCERILFLFSGPIHTDIRSTEGINGQRSQGKCFILGFFFIDAAIRLCDDYENSKISELVRDYFKNFLLWLFPEASLSSCFV